MPAESAFVWGEKLQPVNGKGSRSVIAVAAAIKQNKSPGAHLKLHLSISLALNVAMGEPKMADVFPGRAKDADKLRIVFSKEGAFAISRPKGCGGRMILPLFDLLPDSHVLGATPCEVLEYDKNQLIVRLPIKAWRETIAEASR